MCNLCQEIYTFCSVLLCFFSKKESKPFLWPLICLTKKKQVKIMIKKQKKDQVGFNHAFNRGKKCCNYSLVKDTYRDNAPTNKTSVLSKSINMNICVVGTENQFFVRGS